MLEKEERNDRLFLPKVYKKKKRMICIRIILNDEIKNYKKGTQEKLIETIILYQNTIFTK